MDEVVLRSPTPDDTRAVGEVLASVFLPGDAVVLTGELGAGKTTLVQGIARGLGAEEHVASPTFTLVREYVSGRLPVAHVDVYRLQRMQDVVDLALDELIGGEGVLLVEWGDAVEELLPPERLRVELTVDEAAPGAPGSEVSEMRRIALGAVGNGWRTRLDALVGALATWRSSS